MKELIDYNNGDISVKKVSNGWILLEGGQDENSTMLSAYESDDKQYINDYGTLGDAESLARLLEDAFEGYLRSKRFGGIEITFHEKGFDDEENNI